MELWSEWPSDPDIRVSTYGNVETFKHRWSHLRAWKPLRQHVSNSGYLTVMVSGSGTRLVHRLVAETWIDNPLNYREINHIDGDKFNNHVENLEWSTRSHNIQHAYDLELRAGPNRQIIKVFPTGEVFSSQLEAARALGLHQGDISNCLNGRVRHVNGYTFVRIKE